MGEGLGRGGDIPFGFFYRDFKENAGLWNFLKI